MTEGLKRAIGTRVKTARRRAGLSQEALAAKIRRTPESISNIVSRTITYSLRRPGT
ncbi:MAG: helix-turn-helix transcriptional regulator [Rhizobiales bacterium]|nr:helix-turn-helix transcriptional regulator [Hyphomicrobiales bacterium]